MSFGISGNDPFKSYSSDAEAGGGMGVFARRKRKDEGKEEKKEEDKSLLEMGDEQDEDNLELDMEDASDFLD